MGYIIEIHGACENGNPNWYAVEYTNGRRWQYATEHRSIAHVFHTAGAAGATIQELKRTRRFKGYKMSAVSR